MNRPSILLLLAACGGGTDSSGAADTSDGTGTSRSAAEACAEYVAVVHACYESMGVDPAMSGVDEEMCEDSDWSAQTYECFLAVYEEMVCESPAEINDNFDAFLACNPDV